MNKPPYTFPRLRDEIDLHSARVRFEAAKKSYETAIAELRALLGGKLDE